MICSSPLSVLFGNDQEETTVRAEWQGSGCMLIAAGILHYSF
jgi:hypothetical protein